MITREVNLLTWFGTLLRHGGEADTPMHAALWPAEADKEDWALEIPGDAFSGPMVLGNDADQVLEPGAQPNTVTWRRFDLYRQAERHDGAVRFMRGIAAMGAQFLLMPPGQVALLRGLLSHDWRLPEGGVFSSADIAAPVGFQLRIGPHEFDLTQTIFAMRDGGLEITTPGQVLLLRPVAKRAFNPVRMDRRPDSQQPEFVESEADFAAAAEAKFRIRGEREFAQLPIVADPADRDWLYRHYWRGQLRLGGYEASFPIVKEADKFVLTTRGQEGMVFDESGVSNEAGYLLSSVMLPGHDHFVRAGNTIFLDRAVMDAAPLLRGCYVSVCNGNLSNYYHWVVDGLLPLQMMRPYFPNGAKILIPQSVPWMQDQELYRNAGVVDHLAALKAWGLDDLEIVLAPPPVVRVEQVIYHDFSAALDMPATLLRRARADVLARHERRRGGSLLYLRQRGFRRVINQAEIEHIALRHGFTVCDLDGMAPTAQIALFRDADAIIATHNEGLSNLLYCHPGTRVMELTPDAEYHSCFAEISDKLELLHAILPCPTEDGGFWSNLRVDSAKFRRLLEMLLAVPAPQGAAEWFDEDPL